MGWQPEGDRQMKKADVAVWLMGMGGECQRKQLEMIAEGRYVEKILTGLTDKRLIRKKNRDGWKGYRLTKKGYGYYEERFGEPPVRYDTVRKEVAVRKRLRMYRNVYGMLMAYRTGFGIYNTNPFYQKEQGYYPVIAYQENLNEDIRSSRMSGYLVAGKRGYMVYELLDQDILFRRSVEERTAEIHRLYERKSESNALLLSDDFSVADKILSRGSNGNGKSRIGLEPFFSHMYYYPHTADGFTELKFLLYPERIRKLEKELKSLIVSRAGSYAVMEGLDEEGAEIYFLFAPDLKKMGRMRAEIIPERKSRIFTLSFLAEFVERHFPHSEIFPFDEAKLPE